MNIERLKYFISVADHSSFTKAANENFIAQTAISRHIAALEQELGAQLFYRNNRNVVLTPAGETFYPEAKQICEIYDAALEKLGRVTVTGQRSLRIGFGDYERPLITRVLKRYKTHHPAALFDLFQHNYQDLVYLLMTGKLDIIFTTKYCLKDSSGVEIKEIYPNESKLIASSENPICKKDRITKEEIPGLVFVIQADDKGPYQAAEMQTAFQDEFGILPKRFITVNSLGTKLAMVESGDQVALVPSLVAADLPEHFHVMEMAPSSCTHSPFCVSCLLSNLDPDIRKFMKSASIL